MFLHLGNNKLTSLHASFSMLQNLQTLWLNDNQLFQFPDEVLKCKMIKTLDIENNYAEILTKKD